MGAGLQTYLQKSKLTYINMVFIGYHSYYMSLLLIKFKKPLTTVLKWRWWKKIWQWWEIHIDVVMPRPGLAQVSGLILWPWPVGWANCCSLVNSRGNPRVPAQGPVPVIPRVFRSKWAKKHKNWAINGWDIAIYIKMTVSQPFLDRFSWF